MKISIFSKDLSSQELKNILESNYDLNELDISLEIKKSKITTRGIDIDTLIAVIPPILTVIINLIELLVNISREKNHSKIKIEFNDGTKIEIPSDFPIEKVKSLLVNLNHIDIDRVIIIE